MCIAGSIDIFQEKMSNLMFDLEFVQTYLDDILVISKDTFKDHLAKLCKVLEKQHDAGLQINAPKSIFCTTKAQYLGYVLTQDRIKPQHKKVAAIHALLSPTNIKSLRHFLGLIQYSRDLWQK